RKMPRKPCERVGAIMRRCAKIAAGCEKFLSSKVRRAVSSRFLLRAAAALAAWLEAKSGAVHAVAQASRLGPVRKHMAEMCIAPRTPHLCPAHQERAVLLLGDGLASKRLIKARPPCPGVEFRIR